MSTAPTMYILQIGQRYFSARGGYNGRLTGRDSGTLFNLSDANDRAARMGAGTAALSAYGPIQAAYATTTGLMFVARVADDAHGPHRFTVHRQWADGSITHAGPRDGFSTRDEAVAFIRQKDQDGFL